VRGVDPRLHWFRGAGRARFGLGCAQVVDGGGLSLGQLKAAHQRPGGVGEPDRGVCALVRIGRVLSPRWGQDPVRDQGQQRQSDEKQPDDNQQHLGHAAR